MHYVLFLMYYYYFVFVLLFFFFLILYYFLRSSSFLCILLIYVLFNRFYSVLCCFDLDYFRINVSCFFVRAAPGPPPGVVAPQGRTQATRRVVRTM